MTADAAPPEKPPQPDFAAMVRSIFIEARDTEFDEGVEYMRRQVLDCIARVAAGQRAAPQQGGDAAEIARLRAELVRVADIADDWDKKAAALEAALRPLLERYVKLAGSGDCGFWNPEEEPEVIAARAILSPSAAKAKAGEG